MLAGLTELVDVVAFDILDLNHERAPFCPVADVIEGHFAHDGVNGMTVKILRHFRGVDRLGSFNAGFNDLTGDIVEGGNVETKGVEFFFNGNGRVAFEKALDAGRLQSGCRNESGDIDQAVEVFAQ